MPFCPECSYEYRDYVKACPECKVDLVAKLEAEETSDETYVELYGVADRMEAEVIGSLLDENKIRFLVRDMRVFPIMPDIGLRTASLRIAVAQTQIDEARKLLEEAQADGALTEQGRFL